MSANRVIWLYGNASLTIVHQTLTLLAGEGMTVRHLVMHTKMQKKWQQVKTALQPCNKSDTPSSQQGNICILNNLRLFNS